MRDCKKVKVLRPLLDYSRVRYTTNVLKRVEPNGRKPEDEKTRGVIGQEPKMYIKQGYSEFLVLAITSL